MSTFDRRAVLAGVVAGLFFALPAAVVQRLAGSGSALSPIMLAVIVFSGALAGFGAARPGPRMPLMHGALAGALTFLGPQVVFSLWTRELPNPIGLLLALMTFASLGIIGAYVAVSSAANRAGHGGAGTDRTNRGNP